MNEFRATIKFMTYAAMPSQIVKACLVAGKPSNTVYIQHALCEALSRDLNIPLQDLLDLLPPPQNANKSNRIQHTVRKIPVEQVQ